MSEADFEKTGLGAANFSGVAKKRLAGLESNLKPGTLEGLASERRVDPAEAAQRLRELDDQLREGANLADILENDNEQAA